jgi:HSP20 family protein
MPMARASRLCKNFFKVAPHRFLKLVALQRALDARAGSEWIGRGTAAGGSYPPVNIFQQGDDFIAVLELPGVAKDDLAIEAKEHTLRISGRKAIDYGEGASIHRRERLAGVFDRTIALPIDINSEAVRAEYHDGVLALFIPRAEHEKPRTIKIS